MGRVSLGRVCQLDELGRECSSGAEWAHGPTVSGPSGPVGRVGSWSDSAWAECSRGLRVPGTGKPLLYLTLILQTMVK